MLHLPFLAVSKTCNTLRRQVAFGVSAKFCTVKMVIILMQFSAHSCHGDTIIRENAAFLLEKQDHLQATNAKTPCPSRSKASRILACLMAAPFLPARLNAQGSAAARLKTC